MLESIAVFLLSLDLLLFAFLVMRIIKIQRIHSEVLTEMIDVLDLMNKRINGA